ncbi:MAG: glycosyltransferase family 39 protein [Chloroflexi bacterium]|nr:glycosyltransferase family 39 protein [Chloroflexota bacterium]
MTAGKPLAAPALILAAAFAFDFLRALIVPPGIWNIDEAYHFVDAINAARWLPFEMRAAFGQAGQPPERILGGTVMDPDLLFHWSGGLPFRGTTYYLYQAVPQLFLDGAPDSTRLLVARLASIALHLLTIAFTYHIARRLFPSERWPAIAGAALAAFVPSYSDMMSGVNVDGGAAAVGAMFIAALAGVIRGGSRWGTWTLFACGVLLGLGLKETFLPLFAVAAFSFWLMAERRVRVVAAVSSLALMIGALLWLRPFTEGGAAYWFDARWEYGHDAALVSRAETQTPLGKYALRVSPREFSDGVLQYLPETRVAELRGRTVTWGVWLRASSPAVVARPTLANQVKPGAPKMMVGRAWEFHAFTTRVDAGAQHLALILGSPEDGGTVEYDGAVVAADDYSLGAPPIFSDASATRGEWGGRPFVNLLLNPSAEASWPQVRQAYNLRPWNLNTRLNALLAWRRTLPAFAGLGRWLVANYWSAFGGLVPGLSPRQLIPFALLTAWAGFGLTLVGLEIFFRPMTVNNAARRGALMLLAAAFATWLIVLYRTDMTPNTANVIQWSVSRHAAAGLAATALLLALGILRPLNPRARRWMTAALILVLFAANIWILLGVQIPYYNCPTVPTDCLPTVH